MKLLSNIAFVTLAFTILNCSSRAATIALNFNSLPSAQGWLYESIGNSTPETTIFSVNGSTLNQNSIGIGLPVAGADNVYARAGVVDGVLPFTLDFTARVTASEGPPQSGSFGFAAFVFTGSKQLGLGIDTNRVQTLTTSGVFTISTSIDTTQFHAYRIQGSGSGAMSLFIDGVLTFTGTPLADSHPNGLYLGDATSGQNAAAQVSNYVFAQVPEPSISLLLIGTSTALLWRRKNG